jgi:hypothetical protein
MSKHFLDTKGNLLDIMIITFDEENGFITDCTVHGYPHLNNFALKQFCHIYGESFLATL